MPAIRTVGKDLVLVNPLFGRRTARERVIG
jgi:hypothetical protein